LILTLGYHLDGTSSSMLFVLIRWISCDYFIMTTLEWLSSLASCVQTQKIGM